MDEWIIVDGLTSLDIRELEDAVGAVDKEETPHGSSHHPELALITAVVVVSTLSRTIAVFLNKARRHKGRRFVIKRRTNEGTIRIGFAESTSEEDTLDSETLKEPAVAFHVDPPVLQSEVRA